MNKKGSATIILIGLCCAIILGIFIVIGTYNSFVNKDVNAEEKWANVESAYQRRMDLIPNLVSTVKGYAAHEETVFTEVTRARSQVMAAKTAPELATADAALSGALGRLMLVVENYPDLKSSENFLSLQDELAGTENRVKYERDNYNKAVKTYRGSVRRFPGSMFAGMFGFDKDRWEPFEAAADAEVAPEVSFT